MANDLIQRRETASTPARTWDGNDLVPLANDLPTIPDRIAAGVTPALFAADARTGKRFWEFFAVPIRNQNTRMAYLTAVYRFADWCEGHGRDRLEDIEPMVVANYIEQLTEVYSTATVKQHLAAVRKLYDWLIIGQVVAINPASAVRAPKLVVKKGKTPVLNAEEARMLLESIETNTFVGLRDRALIGIMVYSFARVSAVVNMRVEDYYVQGKRAWFRLDEKGGKHHKVPAHHIAQDYLDAYIEASGLEAARKSPLFRSSGRGRARNTLTEDAISRRTALQMVKRRAQRAGLPADICNHTFRGTGITVYLQNGGTIERAAAIAGHESTRTTQLYDRNDDGVTLDEIERIHL